MLNAQLPHIDRQASISEAIRVLRQAQRDVVLVCEKNTAVNADQENGNAGAGRLADDERVVGVLDHHALLDAVLDGDLRALVATLPMLEFSRVDATRSTADIVHQLELEQNRYAVQCRAGEKGPLLLSAVEGLYSLAELNVLNAENVLHAQNALGSQKTPQNLSGAGFVRPSSHALGQSPHKPSLRNDEITIIQRQALDVILRGGKLDAVFSLVLEFVAHRVGADYALLYLCEDSAMHLNLACSSGVQPLPANLQRLTNDSATLAARTAQLRCATVLDATTDNDDPAWRGLYRRGLCAGGQAEVLVAADGEKLYGVLVLYYAEQDTREVPNTQQNAVVLHNAAQLLAQILQFQEQNREHQAGFETFRGLFNSFDEALIIIDAQGQVLDVNDSTVRLSGQSAEQLIGHHYRKLGVRYRNDYRAIAARFAQVLQGKHGSCQYWVYDAEMREVPMEMFLSSGIYFDKKVIIASLRDVSERVLEFSRLKIERDMANASAESVLPEHDVLRMVQQLALQFLEFDHALVYQRNSHGDWQLLLPTELPTEWGEWMRYQMADSELAGLYAQSQIMVSHMQHGDEVPNTPMLIPAALKRERVTVAALLPVLSSEDGARTVIHLLGSHDETVSVNSFVALQRAEEFIRQIVIRQDLRRETLRQQSNFADLINTIGDFVVVVDEEQRILYYNRTLSEQLGYNNQELLGQRITELYEEGYRDALREYLDDIQNVRAVVSPQPVRLMRGYDGSAAVVVETRAFHGYWNGQRALFTVSRDYSERAYNEERLRLAASVFENAHEGIVITDPSSTIMEVNSTFTEITGYQSDEVRGKKISLLKSGEHSQKFYRKMWESIINVGHWRGEIWNRRRTGENYPELLTISAVHNPEGQLTHYVGIFNDITQIKENQKHLEYLAHYDALTQLPNRTLLTSCLSLGMVRALHEGLMLAVCYLDLDGFKPINDQYGHEMGDRLLIEVSQRLKQSLRAHDVVGRMGGDEFVLLLSVHERQDVFLALDRIIKVLQSQFLMDGHALKISASLGVTIYPNDKSDADALLRHADQAMYLAKQSGRGRYQFYDMESEVQYTKQCQQIWRIRSAIEGGELRLFYQPKVNMHTGQVFGCEALVRWQHPERGILRPDEFLPFIEGRPEDVLLGQWVLHEALRQACAWQSAGINMSVSVNISALHLQQGDFVSHLQDLLQEFSELPPDFLELEILETSALKDLQLAANVIGRCRALGVHFALDDFGTGYSSLTYFRHLHADVLKIDQSFVNSMLDNPGDFAIVESIIGLTRAFGRQVIAEGVESVEQSMVLFQLGCECIQGYSVARPMPPADFVKWLDTFRPYEGWRTVSNFRWTHEDLHLLLAETEHVLWAHALRAWLHGDSTTPPIFDFRQCNFGKWLYGESSWPYRNFDGFKKLRTIHTELHRKGWEIASQQDDPDYLNIVTRGVADIQDISLRLHHAIVQIRTERMLGEEISAQILSDSVR